MRNLLTYALLLALVLGGVLLFNAKAKARVTAADIAARP